MKAPYIPERLGRSSSGTAAAGIPLVGMSPSKRVQQKQTRLQTRFLYALLGVASSLMLVANVYFLWPVQHGPGLPKRYGEHTMNDNHQVASKLHNRDGREHHTSRQTGERIREAVRLRHQKQKELMAEEAALEQAAQLDTHTKARVLELLEQAGVLQDLSAETIAKLPTWSQVLAVAGDKPIIAGLDHCAAYRETVPDTDRSLAAAGLFSTGTTMLTELLRQNCQIPQANNGIHSQVPWGEHSPSHYKKTDKAGSEASVNKDHVLPVVTIRNPYHWMESMCKNPYSVEWNPGDGVDKATCPSLKHGEGDNDWNKVTVTYTNGPASTSATEHYGSLVHLYNEWYLEYEHAADNGHEYEYPVLVVRMEDLIFHTKDTITQVCECAGGTIINHEDSGTKFQYSLKSTPAEFPGEPLPADDAATNLAETLIRYSAPMQPGMGMAHRDYDAAMETLAQSLMDRFHYHHPPPLPHLKEKREKNQKEIMKELEKAKAAMDVPDNVKNWMDLEAKDKDKVKKD